MQQQIDQKSNEDLDSIIEEYKKNYKTYQNYCEFVIKQLNQVENIHAVNYRIKDPEHLRKKIIRKNKEGRNINLSNYKSEITDIIGIRALHVFKDEWISIDEYIRKTFKPFEKIAYFRKGDTGESVFSDDDFIIKNHKYGYRSLHYTFKKTECNLSIIAEIQVRTIFEEAWSEMDHRVRYPNNTDNSLIQEYSLVLNRLSGLGDEMGMNLKNITTHFEKQDKEIQDYINELNIAKNEKTKLLEKIQTRNNIIGLGSVFGILNNLQTKN